MKPELRIRDLRKSYLGGVQALKGVSLSLKPGLFGLLGPNGAGKSTLMRILATLQPADGGSVLLGDIDVLREPQRVRPLLGYLPQEFGFDPRHTAEEFLVHLAALKGVAPASRRRAEVAALLEQTNLTEMRRRPLGTLSVGLKQRFGIAQALLGKPRLLIVDEPTAGLDPLERRRVHDLLSALGEEIIVLLSTHLVGDVSQLCSEMAILVDGAVVFSGRPSMLLEAMRGRLWRSRVEPRDVPALRSQMAVLRTSRVAGRTWAHVFSPKQPEGSFEPAEPDLQDVYFYAIQKSASAGAGP